MDSIIFDLDGTLWDSRKTVVKSWNRVIEKHDKVDRELTEEDFKKTMGLQMEELGRKLFPELPDDDERTELLEACMELENEYIKKEGGRLYEGVEEVLAELAKKYKLFIVSNCQSGYIEAFYHYHGLDPHFIDFEHPGRTGRPKGENIKEVMDRNNLESPVYVGDTDGDRRAAEFAGIPFVEAKYGFGDPERSDYTIEHFEDLLKLF